MKVIRRDAVIYRVDDQGIETLIGSGGDSATAGELARHLAAATKAELVEQDTPLPSSVPDEILGLLRALEHFLATPAGDRTPQAERGLRDRIARALGRGTPEPVRPAR